MACLTDPKYFLDVDVDIAKKSAISGYQQVSWCMLPLMKWVQNLASFIVPFSVGYIESW